MRRKKFWIKPLFKRKRYAVGGIKEKHTEYVEKDTQCDKCENLSECIENGIVISSRTIMDARDHYGSGIGAVCKKDPLSQLFVAIEAYQELRGCLNSEDAMEDDGR